MKRFCGKMITVVDEDIDVFDNEAVDWAVAYRCNAGRAGIEIAHGCLGSGLIRARLSKSETWSCTVTEPGHLF